MKVENSSALDEIMEKARERPEYKAEMIFIELTEEICVEMKKQGITKAELARRIDTSPAYITKLLGGSTNFTVETLTKIASALGREIEICFTEREKEQKEWKTEAVWFEPRMRREEEVKRRCDEIVATKGKWMDMTKKGEENDTIAAAS